MNLNILEQMLTGFMIAVTPPQVTLAQAPSSCGPYEEVLKQLDDKHDEIPMAEFDIDDSEARAVVVARKNRKSLTVLWVKDGVACEMLSGKNLRAAPLPKEAKGKEAEL